MDTTGIVKWVTGTVHSEFGNNRIDNVIVDNNGNEYFEGGYTINSGFSSTLWFENLYISSNNTSQPYITKVDKFGTVIWLKALILPSYFSYNKFIYLTDNHFIFLDGSATYDVDNNIKPLGKVQIDINDYLTSSDLNTIKNCKLTIIDEYQGESKKLGDLTLPKVYVEFGMYIARASFLKESIGYKKQLKGLSINIYPNPVSAVLNFEMQLDINKMCELSLFSFQGKLLDKFEISGLTVIDLIKYKPGIYILQFNDGEQNVIHKICIQH